MKILMRLAALAVTIVPALAQGNYTLTPTGGATVSGSLFTDGGVNKVSINGVVLPGWTWSIIDADNDGKTDDIRIDDGGGGLQDMKDGAGVQAGVTGTSHDGNVAYPSNQNGTWGKQP